MESKAEGIRARRRPALRRCGRRVLLAAIVALVALAVPIQAAAAAWSSRIGW